MNAWVVERTLATVSQQSLQVSDGRRIRIAASLERVGELEQLGPDRRHPVEQQHFEPAPAAVALQSAIGGLSQGPYENATLAGAERPPALAGVGRRPALAGAA